MSLRKLILAALLAPAVAHADGAVIARQTLGGARATIEARVAEARARDPQIFEMARGVDAYRPAGYHRRRSQRPSSTGLVYRRLGARALWALVDLAALDGPSTQDLTPEELRALRVGLLDAIGVAREPAAAPVLREAMLRGADLEVASTAAIGLGQLGEHELHTLLEHARPGDPLLVAAVRGLGASRRPRAVARLGELLGNKPDPTQAQALVDALGEAGSSWAWATGKVGTPAEGEAVRAAAAAALIDAYARPEAELAVETALHRVDAPETARLIENATRRAASPASAARLGQLSARWAATRR